MEKSAAVEAFAAKQDNDGLLNLARVAENAERYPDMCNFMRKLVKKKCEAGQLLEVDERNLLSVAYKNVVGSKRSSWRMLDQLVNDAESKGEDNKMDKAYMKQVEGELQEICKEVIGLLGPDLGVAGDGTPTTEQMMKFGDNTLLKTLGETKDESDKNNETMVFYLKMVGDYCRYLAEINNETAKKFTAQYYEKAMTEARDKLAETHPTRLGLALNYSVCYYEIMKEPLKACDLAKKAFDGAIEKLDTLNDASYKDSTLIMQLLRDNLTLWTSEANKPGDDGAANP